MGVQHSLTCSWEGAEVVGCAFLISCHIASSHHHIPHSALCVCACLCGHVMHFVSTEAFLLGMS